MFRNLDKMFRNVLMILSVIFILLCVVFLTQFVDNGDDVNESDIVSSVKFDDIEKGTVDYDVSKWAVETGVVRGYLDGTFRPNETIREYQFMIMMYSFFGLGELNYITSMIDESNLNVKNIEDVYDRLRAAGLFVAGTNSNEDTVYVRKSEMSVESFLSNIVWILNSEESRSEDMKFLTRKFGFSGDLSRKVTKIEILRVMYVLNKEKLISSNSLEVNPSFSSTESYMTSGDRPRYGMYDSKSRLLITVTREPRVEKKGKNYYTVEVSNVGKTPYEFFGYSLFTIEKGGVKSINDTSGYVALGGESVIKTTFEDRGVDRMSLVLGGQVIQVEGTVFEMMEDIQEESEMRLFKVDGITLEPVDVDDVTDSVINNLVK